MLKNYLKFTLVFAILLIVGTSVQAATSKKTFAVINMQALLKDALVVKNINSQVEKYKTKLKKEAKTKEKALQDKQKKLLDQKEKLSAELKEISAMEPSDERSEKEASLEKKAKKFTEDKDNLSKQVKEVQDKIYERNTKIDNVSRDAYQEVQKTIQKIVEQVAVKSHYSIIYRASALAFYQSKNDITKSIVKKLNQKIKKVQLKKPY